MYLLLFDWSDEDKQFFSLVDEIQKDKFESINRQEPIISELIKARWNNDFGEKIKIDAIRLPFPIQYELFEKIATEKNYRQYISKLELLFDITGDENYRQYILSDLNLSKYSHLLNSNTLDCLKFINAKSWDELKNLYYNINPLCLRKCPQLNLLFFQAFVLKSRETEDNYSQLDRVAFHFNLIFRASKISGISYDQVKALIPDFDIKSKKEENDDDKGKKENDHDEPESFSTTATTTTNKKRKVIEATAATSTATKAATAIAGGQYLEQEPIAKRTRCKKLECN